MIARNGILITVCWESHFYRSLSRKDFLSGEPDGIEITCIMRAIRL